MQIGAAFWVSLLCLSCCEVFWHERCLHAAQLACRVTLCMPCALSGAFTHALACSSSDLPNFFASTKFFACLDLLESKELFEATEMVQDATFCAQLVVQNCSDQYLSSLCNYADECGLTLCLMAGSFQEFRKVL